MTLHVVENNSGHIVHRGVYSSIDQFIDESGLEVYEIHQVSPRQWKVLDFIGYSEFTVMDPPTSESEDLWGPGGMKARIAESPDGIPF